MFGVFVRSNIGFSLQLTYESSTTCMHESMIPYASNHSCSSLLCVFHVSEPKMVPLSVDKSGSNVLIALSLLYATPLKAPCQWLVSTSDSEYLF